MERGFGRCRRFSRRVRELYCFPVQRATLTPAASQPPRHPLDHAERARAAPTLATFDSVNALAHKEFTARARGLLTLVAPELLRKLPEYVCSSVCSHRSTDSRHLDAIVRVHQNEIRTHQERHAAPRGVLKVRVVIDADIIPNAGVGPTDPSRLCSWRSPYSRTGPCARGVHPWRPVEDSGRGPHGVVRAELVGEEVSALPSRRI